jgi:phosphotransferase system, enzyme I, PtsP
MSEREPDHLGLLCDVGDLAARLAGSADIEAFLGQIVGMVAEALHSAVASIYLFEDPPGELVLRATHGLRESSVGRVRMKIGEGLAGMALRELRPICETNASSHPSFKRFEGIDEELYESFLAVPIQKGLDKIGVLVTQRDQREPFRAGDILALRAIASQLAGAIENARILMSLRSPVAQEGGAVRPLLVRGQVASEGFAQAPATIRDSAREHGRLAGRKFERIFTHEEFHSAVDRTAKQLEDLQGRLGERLPEMVSLIFDAHLMMLKDPAFIGEMGSRIEAGGNPPDVVMRVLHTYVDLLSASPHAYIREKSHDVEDLSLRLLKNLIGEDEDDPGAAESGMIVIARDLYPSDVLKLALADVSGIVLVRGGLTSHVSILARSLRIPLVIAEDIRLLELPERTPVLLDGRTGNVHVRPTKEVATQLSEREAAHAHLVDRKIEIHPETRTRDGQRVVLLANVNLLRDAEIASEANAEGVGLYRSEFPFLIRSDLPSEQEQYLIYHRLFETMDGRRVTFRTLDLGGDKLLAYYDSSSGEENPALGLRSIRFSLRHREVFQRQLHAVLRAAAGNGELRLMFPMISSVDEFREAREVLAECIDHLHQRGAKCHDTPLVGMMVEVPSAVEMADELAAEADFFCIGTNDLIQYYLAVDRTNEKVAIHFAPHHPAVLRALKRIVDAGRRHGREVSLCGEMAHQEAHLPFLLGIGLTTLSVDPLYLSAVQNCVERWSMEDARRHADTLLKESTLSGVRDRLRSAGLIGDDD